MTDDTREAGLAEFTEAQGTAPPGTSGEPEPAGRDEAAQSQRALPDVTVQSLDAEQQRARTIAEIETIAIAARAAWRSAEDAHLETRNEARALYANFKKIVDHRAAAMKQLEARFEQSEQKTHGLFLEANRLIAEHQAMAAQFNRTTRRIALSGFAIVLILLVLLEISWLVN